MKASVYIATSLDGFIARKDGKLDWLPGANGEESNPEADQNEDYGFNAFMESIDVLVMGRNTYDMVQSFGKWPYGEKRVIVMSSNLVRIPKKLTETVSSKNCSPAELVQELAESGAKHLYIDGGKTIQGFLNAGLINEIIITRIPVLIGTGIPLFGPLDQDQKLRHIETRSFPNGLVQSRYEVVR